MKVGTSAFIKFAVDCPLNDFDSLKCTKCGKDFGLNKCCVKPCTDATCLLWEIFLRDFNIKET